NTWVTNKYSLSGLLTNTYGSRIYPVAYTYDYAGRMKTMKTWTNFTSNLGAAVTTWNYDIYRGWLTNKAYADGHGPTNTYTAAGRLLTRTWARAVTTTYGYTGAGDLSTVTYSDSTPAVTYAYDRRGRQSSATAGTSIASFSYNDANEQTSESYSGGPLDTIS